MLPIPEKHTPLELGPPLPPAALLKALCPPIGVFVLYICYSPQVEALPVLDKGGCPGSRRVRPERRLKGRGPRAGDAIGCVVCVEGCVLQKGSTNSGSCELLIVIWQWFLALKGTPKGLALLSRQRPGMIEKLSGAKHSGYICYGNWAA